MKLLKLITNKRMKQQSPTTKIARLLQLHSLMIELERQLDVTTNSIEYKRLSNIWFKVEKRHSDLYNTITKQAI